MADYEHRNLAFDYSPPRETKSVAGPLLVVGGIIVLFFLAMLFIGGGEGTVVPPVEDTGAPVAPVVPAPAE